MPSHDPASEQALDDVLKSKSAEEWIGAGLAELAKAKSAFEAHQQASASAALKRAAGMALNGALCVVPRRDWGRSFVEHLQALGSDVSAPESVRQAASELVQFAPGAGGVVLLRVRSHDERLLDAAQTVMAHAYAIVYGGIGRPAEPQ